MENSDEVKILLAAAELHKSLEKVMSDIGISNENGEDVVSSLLHVLQRNNFNCLSNS